MLEWSAELGTGSNSVENNSSQYGVGFLFLTKARTCATSLVSRDLVVFAVCVHFASAPPKNNPLARCTFDLELLKRTKFIMLYGHRSRIFTKGAYFIVDFIYRGRLNNGP